MEKSIEILGLEKKKYERELAGIKEEAKKNIARIKNSESTIADLDRAIKKLKPKK